MSFVDFIPGLNAVGNVVSSLISSNASRKNTKETNQANIDIANANNAAAREMFDENIRYNTEAAEKDRQFAREQFQAEKDWAIEKFNMENAYNDPSAQRERLLAAGINPSAMIGSQGYGSFAGQVGDASASAVSSPSASGIPGLSTPTMLPTDYLGMAAGMRDAFSSVVDGVLKISQADNYSANTKAILSQVEAQLDKARAEAAKLWTDGKISSEQYKQSVLENDFLRETFKARVQGVELDNKYKDEKIKEIADGRAYIQSQKLRLEKLLPKELKEKDAVIRQLKASAHALYVEANQAVLNGQSLRDLNFAQRQKISGELVSLGVETGTARKISNALVKKAERDSRKYGSRSIAVPFGLYRYDRDVYYGDDPEVHNVPKIPYRPTDNKHSSSYVTTKKGLIIPR